MHTPRPGEVIEAAPARIIPSAVPTAHAMGWGTGIDRLAPFTFTPPEGLWDRTAAMSIPTISRARDLICTAVGALPLVLFTFDWTNPALPIEKSLPPAIWMPRPDPNRKRNFTLTWLADDLFFYGRGYWRVTDRYAAPQSYPRAFQWMPATV